ncbi:MAG: MFS transporter [Chloroflexi bacterium]|nr:MFS transporter [Chloroflexota bacterium]
MTTINVSDYVRQRITATLFTGQSLFSAAMIASFTLMPIIAANLSGNDATAGFPSTLTLLGRAVAAYPMGLLMGKAGRRMGLSTGYGLAILGAIVSVIAIMVGSFWGFCAGAALMGMGRGGIDQGRYVAAEVNVAEKRAKVIGLIVFAGTIGAVLGPILVPASQKFVIRLGLDTNTGPYVVAAVMLTMALIITWLFLRPDPKQIATSVEIEETDSAQSPARPLAQIFRQPPIILAIASMIIGQLVMALIMVITPLYMDHNNHSSNSISFVIMAHTLGMFGLSGVTGWLIDRYSRVPLIIAGAGILIAASIMTPRSTEVLPLAIALFLLGLGWNFCFIAGSSLLTDSLAANERPRTQGASEVMVSLAAGAGGVATGLVFARGTMTAVSAVALAFSLALIGILLLYSVSKQKVQLTPG